MTQNRIIVKMKAIILTLVFIAFGTDSFSQKKNIYGAMVGGSLSSLTNYSGKPTLSLTGGLYWESKLKGSFYLQSNFLYSQRGESTQELEPKLTLHYLNLPIMTKYHLTTDFHIMCGIYWDVLLGMQSDLYTQSELKSSDFGIPLALSYNLSKNFQIGLSYSFGLINISSIPNNDMPLKNHWGNVTMAALLR